MPERVHEYRNHHLDSTRWDRYSARDHDVVITTAYKAGTTWTQRIMASLILGPGRLYAPLWEISPWVDARTLPAAAMLARLDAQEHRRFVKSHLAADGLRFYPEAKYIVVGRDTRDVFMSLYNHYAAYTESLYGMFNDAERPGPELPRCPESPLDLWPRWIGEGWFDWEPDRLAVLVTLASPRNMVGGARPTKRLAGALRRPQGRHRNRDASHRGLLRHHCC
jgi:aryl sulfotransferase